MIRVIWTTIMILGISTGAFAGPLDSFLKYSQDNGAMTSINSGGVIEDQRSGYFTGGSIIHRGPRPKELQPLSVQLPSFNFDPCTGSGDLRWGGFSYIKSKQLTDFFKGVAAAAPAYVVKMLIKSINVQSENILSELESIARYINGITFDQCEVAKSAAEGLLGKFNAASTQKCMAKAAKKKSGDDLFANTQNCQNDPSRFGQDGDEDVFKAVLPDNYNLVWKALSHGDHSSDKEMKELIMSISGSIIGRKQDGTSTITSLPSLIEKEDLIEKYIGKPGEGTSSLKIYVCGDDRHCLNPTIQDKDINNDKTLYGKIHKTLNTIIDKIVNNTGDLDDEEKALIEYSTIPLISLFEIELALRNKESVANLAGDSAFIEVVCYDMITNFMRKMLVAARDAVNELQTAQYDNMPIERFNKNIEFVQNRLRDKKYEAMQKLQTILSVKERLTQQQRVFQMGFGRLIEN